jgi:Zn-dependent protease
MNPMSEQRNPNLWLPPRPEPHDPYVPSADDLRVPPEPERSPDPEPSHDPFGGDPKPWWKRAGGAIAAAAIVVVKFAAKLKAVLLLLPKLKILTTSGSMLVSVAAYSLIWGWKFAFGFVVLLLVHEMGHVIQLRREGIEASAPLFIPFFGAAVWSKSLGDNAVAEARVGLAGPILGSIGAALCIPIADATGNEFWRALAFTGFFLNLFNLLPVVPLDGGRAMAAMAPWMWFVGLGAVLVLVFMWPNPILILIALFGAMEVYRRWSLRKKGEDGNVAYYKVRPSHRALVAVVYIGLIVALAVGMDLTFIERSFSDV